MTLPTWLQTVLPDWLLAKIGEWTVPAWVQLMADSFWPLLHAGLVFTVPLTLMSFALGLALAFVVALIRLFGPAPLVAVVRFYVWLIRGTPLLVQLFVIFYGLPSVGIVLDPLPAALIGFTLNVGAYNSEVIRGAIESITKGQWEAAYSLSMTRGQALRRTILPQAARVAVPPLSNSFIALVKDTSLAAVLTVPEIFQAAQRIAAVTYEPLILYTEAALIYLVFSSVLSAAQVRLERRFGQHAVFTEKTR
jgi:cystine transport system permease protein